MANTIDIPNAVEKSHKKIRKTYAEKQYKTQIVAERTALNQTQEKKEYGKDRHFQNRKF